jgi:hypothetical protein
VSSWQHALVQDTNNSNSSRLLPVEEDVFTLVHSTQPGTYFVVGSAQQGVARNKPAAFL